MLKVWLLFLVVLVAGVASFPEKRALGCYTACPMYIITFCGSDGKTYSSNECFERNRLCGQGDKNYKDFRSVHYGACTGKETTTSTQTVTTAKILPGVQSILEKRAMRCNSFCPMYIVTFCGSDGKTYSSNECFERSRLCSQGDQNYQNFRSVHFGACTGKETTVVAQKTTTAKTLIG